MASEGRGAPPRRRDSTECDASRSRAEGIRRYKTSASPSRGSAFSSSSSDHRRRNRNRRSRHREAEQRTADPARRYSDNSSSSSSVQSQREGSQRSSSRHHHRQRRTQRVSLSGRQDELRRSRRRSFDRHDRSRSNRLEDRRERRHDYTVHRRDVDRLRSLSPESRHPAPRPQKDDRRSFRQSGDDRCRRHTSHSEPRGDNAEASRYPSAPRGLRPSSLEGAPRDAEPMVKRSRVLDTGRDDRIASRTTHEQERLDRAKQEGHPALKMKEEISVKDEEQKWGPVPKKKTQPGDNDEVVQVEKPSFEPSGLLARASGLQKGGVDLKYVAPADHRTPVKGWRLYLFKKESHEEHRILKLHKKDHFLFGKDVRVCDVPCLHPTVSKQHAVIQFRLKGDQVAPYLIDLESTNGTFLNDERLDPARYYELREKDILSFGKSSREFILLHDRESLEEKIAINMDEFISEHSRKKMEDWQKEKEKLLAKPVGFSRR